MRRIDLTVDELTLLLSALSSHERRLSDALDLLHTDMSQPKRNGRHDERVAAIELRTALQERWARARGEEDQ